ncbi:MAG TPA: hypothetical protein VEG35_05510 [Burkholderiales bacterium]|nr:hypothetical protein [Burkholderiales bacterium]
MSWGAYAILIIFGAFVLLLLISPNMSCFGKRLRSPFYPLRRKRQGGRGVRDDLKKKMTDYKFDLGGPPGAGADSRRTEREEKAEGGKPPDKKIEDYGFHPR